MMLEIYGGGFGNKGAELMLRTTVERLRNEFPEAEFAIEPKPNESYLQHAELRLARIFPSTSIYPKWSHRFFYRSAMLRKLAMAPLRVLMPKLSSSMLGLVSRKECDGMIDISGYAYGDGFPPLRTKASLAIIKNYRHRNKPVIFMPQMYGPFDNPKTRDAFKECMNLVTHAYARDQSSFQLVQSIMGPEFPLGLAPDITIFSTPTTQDNHSIPNRKYGCIVPNERMLDQGKDEWGDNYLNKLKATALCFKENNLKTIFVIHSNDPGDSKMAHKLANELAPEIGDEWVSVYGHKNPKVLKQFIAGSHLLVGSRFHSVVAALSSGVPAIVLGWAHKYEAIISDFSVPTLKHSGTEPVESLLDLVNNVCNSEANANYRSLINTAKQRMQTEAETMWDDISHTLNRNQ